VLLSEGYVIALRAVLIVVRRISFAFGIESFSLSLFLSRSLALGDLSSARRIFTAVADPACSREDARRGSVARLSANAGSPRTVSDGLAVAGTRARGNTVRSGELSRALRGLDCRAGTDASPRGGPQLHSIARSTSSPTHRTRTV